MVSFIYSPYTEGYSQLWIGFNFVVYNVEYEAIIEIEVVKHEN
jgi:hypothetical protein